MKTDTVRTSVCMTPKMWANVKALARKHGISAGCVIRDSIDDRLRREGLDPERIPKCEVQIGYDGGLE